MRAILLLLFSQIVTNAALAAAPAFTTYVDQADPFQIVTLEGTAAIGDGERIVKAMSGLVRGKSVMFVLNFNGGFEGSIAKVFKRVREVCSGVPGCVITTFVPERSECDSLCLELFMAGTVRRASREARFGLHGVWIGWPGFEEIVIPGEMERRLQAVGVNSAWLREHASDFQSSRITYFAPDQLSGSGLVTEIIN